ncbi:MAG: hypothetical protein AAF638_05975 [Pseudomonadota bacterium]
MSTGPVMTPLALYGVAAKMMFEQSLTGQKAFTDGLERFAQSDEKPTKWASVDVPMANLAYFFDEELLRERFHKLADSNLRSWEYAAEMLQAAPSWAAWPSKVPGTVMTDVFDRMRRASKTFMPANDAWKLAAENFSPPSFWAKAVKGPALLETPNGTPDDLTLIKGIGGKLSAMLNDLGIYHFSQIAAWTEADGEWIDDQLAFKGRVAREKWVDQAKAFAGEAAA